MSVTRLFVVSDPHLPPSRPAHRLSARSRATSLLAALGAALALVLGAPSAALAHDRLISSDPADGATLETAPEAITLTFSDEPLDVSPQVRITGDDGTVLVDGAPSVEGTTATMPLPDGLPAGHATVQWRVVSTDGHPIEGELGFDVTQGSQPAAEPATPTTEAAEQPSSATPATSAAPSAAPAEAGEGGGLGPLVIAAIAFPVVAIIAAGIVLMRRRR